MSIESSQQHLTASIEGEQLVVRAGVEYLLNIIPFTDTWPTNSAGDPCKIKDKEQFLKDLICELGRENEQGATLIHLAIDEAAAEVTEQGYESVELPEDFD